MMAAVGRWLLVLIAVSLMCALADALMPKGAVRRVGRLLCGIVLVSVILGPLANLDVEAGQRWLENHLVSVEFRKAELEQEVNEQMKVIIERNYAAYIVDKAAQLGAACSARVRCRLEDGLYLPAQVEIGGTVSPDIRTELVRVIVQELGVSEEQISFGEEDVP